MRTHRIVSASIVLGLLVAPTSGLASDRPSNLTAPVASGEVDRSESPSDQSTAGDSVELRNENSRMARKLWRAELLTGIAQAGGLVSLMVLPESVTGWTDEPWKHPGENLRRAWTSAPVVDSDVWYLNYLGHPYGGALYYNALRSQGGTRRQAFWYSVAQSTVFEYLIEAIAEHPSIQDLIATPVVGSLLGELCHQATLKMNRNGFNAFEKIVVFVINPMFVLNNGYHPPHRNGLDPTMPHDGPRQVSVRR